MREQPTALVDRLWGGATDTGSQTPLPAGYCYELAAAVEAAELVELLHDQVGWDINPRDVTGRGWLALAKSMRITDVAVRNGQGQLAGFASLFYRDRAGQLANLAVRPCDRRRGLGKVLVNERLRLAAAVEVDSLYIPPLLPTNSLHSYYQEQGFTKTARGALVRGPQPVSILGD